MPHLKLNDRQRREADFYRQYASRQAQETITFDPVEGQESRPWNPYWYVYQYARQHYLGPWQRALDFGCGIGIAGLRLAHLGYEVQGFDLSEDNIKLAQTHARETGLDARCRFSVQLAEQLDYPDDHFDLLLGIDILHHVDIPKAITEARRVLKPGGVAIFKEHVEVPLVDRVRQSAPVRLLAPTESSLDHHITHDERKLNDADMQVIHQTFSSVQQVRFTILGHLERFTPGSQAIRQRLQQLDHRLMQLCPPLASLGGTAVLICAK